MGSGIFIALGANLPGLKGEAPIETLQGALGAMAAKGIEIQKVSRAYESPPWPPSGQPWYVNAAIEAATGLAPEELLKTLLGIEEQFGRQRLVKNAARILDLDIIDFNGLIHPSPGRWRQAAGEKAPHGFFLPHLRAHERDFVLKPLVDLSPGWVHPVLKIPGAELLEQAAKGKTLRAAKAVLKKP